MNIFTKAASSIQKFFGDSGQSFSTWGWGGLRTKTQYELLFEYRGVVYSCVEAISDDVARYEPYAAKVNYAAGTEKPLQTHPLIDLLRRPNPTTTQSEFMKATQAYKDITGNSYWYLELGLVTRRPKSMLVLRPDRVRKVIDKDTGEIAGWLVKRDNGTEIALEPDEIVQIKRFNPLNDHLGLGVIQANQLYVDTEKALSTFQFNFIKNAASPSGIVTLKNKMSKEAFQKLKKQWKEQHAGEGNAGKTLFMRESEATFTKIGLSLNELDVNLRSMSKEDIREAFRVPQIILGKTDSSGLGRANAEVAEYIFAKRTIEPNLTALDDTLTMMLKTYYKETDTCIMHTSQIPEDKEAELARLEKGVDKWITRNEARAMQGLEAVDGGDVLYLSLNQMPIASPQQASLGKIKIKFVKKAEQEPIEKQEIKQKITMHSVLPESDVIEASGSSRYQKKIIALLNEQKRKVLSHMGKSAKVFDKAMPSLDAESFAFTEALLPILLGLLKQSGNLIMDNFGQPDVEFLITQGIRDAIFASTKRLTRDFTEETVLKLQKQLAEGVTNNESTAELKRRIESVYEEATGSRAERIARTEAHKAVNEAHARAFEQIGYRKITWRARAGACEYCKALDGMTVNIGQSFVPVGATINGTDGGEYVNDYVDIQYADAHPHCDCYLEPSDEVNNMFVVPVKMDSVRIEDVESVVNTRLKDFSTELLKKLDE